jgi:hypothetical protein
MSSLGTVMDGINYGLMANWLRGKRTIQNGTIPTVPAHYASPHIESLHRGEDYSSVLISLQLWLGQPFPREMVLLLKISPFLLLPGKKRETIHTVFLQDKYITWLWFRLSPRRWCMLCCYPTLPSTVDSTQQGYTRTHPRSLWDA